MPNDHGWRVDWYSCTRRNKDGDINSLLEKHKESTGWRIVSPLPKKRPPSWDSVDAGLWLRGQQRTPFFQGHTGAFVVTLGPFHAQCTPQDTAQRRSGIPVQKSYHMSLCFFYSSPIQYDWSWNIPKLAFQSLCFCKGKRWFAFKSTIKISV